jgi:hypothetical protein
LVLLLAISQPTAGQSFQFSTSDLEGSWTGYYIEINPAIPAVYWLRGTATIDGSGNLLSGVYVTPDGSTVNATGGLLELDPKGVLSGSFAIETGDTVSIVHGKQDQSKTNATLVTAATDGSLDIGYFFKNGGNFVASDLIGTWYGYQTMIVPATGAVFWLRGSLDIDAAGNVTGSFAGPDGTTILAEGGTVSVDSNGFLSGGVALSSGQEGVITDGKVDQGKTKAVFVGTASDGSLTLCQLVKAGGTFKPSDAVGHWYAYGLGIDPSAPAVYWAYGNLEYDTSGNSFTGSYTAPTGETVATTGTATLDAQGLATISATLSTGGTSVSPSIKFDQRKTTAAGVTISPTSGDMGIWQFVKESYLTGPFVRQVQRMYIAYYGRSGDPGGVAYWTGRLVEVGGNWIADLVNAFGTSPEYTERFGALSAADLIENLYQQLFNRSAENDGLRFYVDLLNGTNNTGWNPTLRVSTLAQIALDIANGAQNEDLTTLQNKEAVAEYFTNRIIEANQCYVAKDIPEAVAMLRLVTFEDDSVTAGLDAVEDFVESAFIDSDGDGVHDGCDVCPGEDDTVDANQDGIPDCLD